MSDQSPPPTKPKPGSLRDRIAAFENKGVATPGPTPGAPVPRPKPGNFQWKPRPPSPSTSPDLSSKTTGGGGSCGGAGMSASDAKESISRGGTLKERMAALQGKGAFGDPSPALSVPPKPVIEKPKWKPPPRVASPPAIDDGVAGRAASRSPSPRRTASPSSDVLSRANEGEADAAATEGDQGITEPEEEERQRRAAIAARMARLGGARIGMAPPVIAPKPVMRKASVPVPASSPPPAPEPEQEKSWTGEQETLQLSQVADEPSRRGSLGAASIKDEIAAEPEPSLEPKDSDQASIVSASSSRAPTSMPVPAGPRRAAPPRRKTYKSPPSGPLPEPPAPVPAPAQVDSEMTDVAPPSSDVAGPETPEFLPSEEPTVSAPDEMLVSGDIHTEISKSVDVLDDAHVTPEQQVEFDEGTVLVEQPTELIDEQENMEEEPDPLQKKGEVSIEGSSMYETAEDEHHGAVLDTEPEQDEQELQPESEPESEEDEATRRKRVADKLITIGAFNPLDPSFPVSPPYVEEPVDVDTEQVAENMPAIITVPPTVEETEDQHAHSTPEVDVEETKVELEDGEQEEYEHETVQPAPVERDDGHEPELERAHEPALSTEAEVTRRVLYHNTGVDDDGELERTVSPPLDADAVDSPSQYIHQVNTSDILVKRTSVCSRKGDTEPPSVLATKGEAGVEKKAGMYMGTNAGAALQAADDGNEDVTPTSQDDNDIALPHPTRPILPPPVVVGSNPASLSSPPPKTALQTLKDDDDERAASPDIPPRPIPPPPMRSVSHGAEGDARGHARRFTLPPPRRTSLGVAEPSVGSPVSATPSVQISPPRPTRRPTSPPILTALPILQEPGQMGGDEDAKPSALEEKQSGVQEPEDDESARRRTIAERMARLGGIRFDAPPSMHHLARPPMPPVPPPTSIPPDDAETETGHKDDEDEAARKERIAAKLAGMGGTRFGMLPHSVPVGMAPASARRLVSKQEDSESEDVALPVPAPASQRGPPSRKLPPPTESEPVQPDLEGSRVLSDDGVKVEAEESEIEEVHYSDADVRSEEEAPPLPPPRRPVATSKPLDALPTPPPRSPPGRPPVPALPGSFLARRASGTAGSVNSRNSSADYSSTAETPVASSRARTSQEGIPFDSGLRPQSEYVMVEVDEPEENPAPARRSTRVPPPSIPLPPPPPPSAIDPPEDLASSAQWELPSIPQGAEFIADSDVASSGWSDDSTAVHFAPPPPPLQAPVLSNILSISPSTQATPAPSRRSTSSIQQEQVLSAEDLMTVWGKVGAQVAQAASDLFEKSKRTLVGDGSYAGFVRAVLAQVPGALRSPDPEEWGYVVYGQTGTTVQRRVVEIMPGDVIAFWDAKLKGHKALHAYSQTAGAGESGALVGVVSECEPKKMKVKVWQANQHVGQQTVENVSYRLEDLKSGRVKIYRILEKAM